MPEKITGAIQEQLAQPGSSFRKYQQSVVGNTRFIDLMLYEVINLVCMSLPSLPKRFGYRWRRIGLSIISDHIGENVQIGPNNSFLQPKKLHLKDNVETGNDVTFGIKITGGGIILRENVTIGDNTIFNCSGGTITIGRGTKIQNDCRLGSLKGLTVGAFCTIGQHTCISGAGHTFSDLNRPIINQPLVSKGHTVIQDGVEIGERVTILDGIFIGSKSKIVNDSLVIKDIPPESQVSGIPARSCF
ncbi:MAG: acyltransferase [Desulfobacterales bacterium]|nr:acyltransferase [Desulfobacterales bacterium]